MNQGNQGAERLVAAIHRIAGSQISGEREMDLGTIRPDYSLVTDTFPVPIPQGEWSTVEYLAAETIGNDMKNEWRLGPGDRVVAAWIGNEAVVIGRLTRL